MRALWMLVFSGSLATGTQAYAPIQMMKGPAKGVVTLTRRLPTSSRGGAPAQKLIISDQPDSLPRSMIPYFSPKLDHTITWDEMDWCLEADGHHRGDTVGVNRCNKGPNQKWSWLPNGKGNLIQLQDTNLCLNVADKQGRLSGAPIELQECGDWVTYTWMFEEDSSLLSKPSQGGMISDEGRHAMISLTVLAVIGMLSLSTCLRRREGKASTEVLSQGSTPLNSDQGGVSLTVLLEAPQGNALFMPRFGGNARSMVPAVMAQSPKLAENHTMAEGRSVIVKPDTHRREYSYVQLDNGLRAILGSDPVCDQAGAALCVNVGLVHERQDLPGLAHFLEHMVCGNQTDAGPAGYKAVTECFFTKFTMVTNPGMLEPALDRFSRFFYEPLLTKDYADLEINAVDSEFQGGSTDPFWRYIGIMNMSANPDHPFHVANGNNKTLRDEPKERGIDLYEEMKKLYESCYSANGMTLSVIGKQSIEDLEAMVKDKFGVIVNKGVTMPIGDAVSSEPAFLKADWNRLVLQNPVWDIKRLTFSWVIPYQGSLWRTKPTAYIKNLLGREGPGCMISALKQKGLIAEGNIENCGWLEGCFSVVNVRFELTDAGLDCLEEIGRYLFTFIALLQKTPVQKWIFDEMRKSRSIQFKFEDDQYPSKLSQQISRNLQELPHEEVLAADYLLYDYDPDAISSVLSLLTLDSVRVWHQAKCLAEQCTEKVTWYDSPMAFLPIKEEWLSQWSSAMSPGDGSSAAIVAAADAIGLHLPKPNPFIPSDLSLCNLPADPPALPVKLAGELPSPLACIYHRQDDVFLQPKACVQYLIYSPFITQDVESFTQCELWCNCVREALNFESPWVSYELTVSHGALNLTLEGFNDKLDVLLDAVLKKIWSMVDVPENIYSTCFDLYNGLIKNSAFKSPPREQCSMRLDELVSRGSSFPAYQRHEALQKLTREKLSGTAKSIFKQCHIEALHLGNASPDDAVELGTVLARSLATEGPAGALAELPKRYEAALPDGSTLWRLPNTNDADPNNAVSLLIQVPDSVENMVNLILLHTLLKPQFYNFLRSQCQLGYFVDIRVEPFANFACLFGVVESEFRPEYVRFRIEQFLERMFEFVEEELSQEQFEICRQGLISFYKTKPNSLCEELEQYNVWMTQQTYDFGRNDRACAFCESSATIDTFRSFLKDVVRPAPRMYNYVKKVLDQPDRDLPEDLGHQVKKVLDQDHDRRIWSTHLETVESFQSSAKWLPVGSSRRVEARDSKTRERMPNPARKKAGRKSSKKGRDFKGFG